MRRWIAAIACVALLACADTDEPSQGSGSAPVGAEPRDAKPVAPAPAPKPPPSSRAWTFAVLSDLHLPNYRHDTVDQTIAALIDMKVRFVVVTGDHTNGSAIDGPARIKKYGEWWAAVTKALQPLRDARIAVFPVAGNHDSYIKAQRDSYAAAFSDLESWAKPFVVRGSAGATQVTRPPFTYSVDVDDVHLSLIHVVKSQLDSHVASWLAADLEAAKGARHRFVFSHVPLSSVIWSPSKKHVGHLGAILERGKVGMYIAGHEHIVWDEDVALPERGKLRQLIVGCVSGYYDYGPSEPSKRRASCVPIKVEGRREPMKCKMPNGGEFQIARGRKNRHLQHHTNAFMTVIVDGDQLRARPMTVGADGKARPFYLDE